MTRKHHHCLQCQSSTHLNSNALPLHPIQIERRDAQEAFRSAGKRGHRLLLQAARNVGPGSGHKAAIRILKMSVTSPTHHCLRFLL